MSKRLRICLAGGLFLSLALGSGATHAQAYPSGPLRIVVPFQACGSTDIVARAMAQKLRDRFNQPAVVENRAGANGTIGAALVAKSPPDGHTMLLVQSGYVSNPILFRNLPYDQARDLAPVSSLASGPMVLVVHPSDLTGTRCCSSNPATSPTRSCSRICPTINLATSRRFRASPPAP